MQAIEIPNKRIDLIEAGERVLVPLSKIPRGAETLSECSKQVALMSIGQHQQRIERCVAQVLAVLDKGEYEHAQQLLLPPAEKNFPSFEVTDWDHLTTDH